ncbi:hypothetical protein D9613_006394 [Agrocybe pediades]|uniref:Uncharacterized protein n=1 Tax=Agrocybe pediades TaxID=84607 RepID=A0A8H4QUQ2_9AGAR|nr:hypothetical protein D9613_006394 [Agrocybe pediades]
MSSPLAGFGKTSRVSDGGQWLHILLSYFLHSPSSVHCVHSFIVEVCVRSCAWPVQLLPPIIPLSHIRFPSNPSFTSSSSSSNSSSTLNFLAAVHDNARHTTATQHSDRQLQSASVELSVAVGVGKTWHSIAHWARSTQGLQQASISLLAFVLFLSPTPSSAGAELNLNGIPTQASKQTTHNVRPTTG